MEPTETGGHELFMKQRVESHSVTGYTRPALQLVSDDTFLLALGRLFRWFGRKLEISTPTPIFSVDLQI